MFDNPFFNSIIALITLYLIFSQLTLSLVELPAGFLNTRGRYLYEHLQVALGPRVWAALYAAPAIQALMAPVTRQSWPMQLLKISRWPTYISETLFAQTIIDWVGGLAPVAAPPRSAIAQFQAGLAVLSGGAPAAGFAEALGAMYTSAAAAATDPEKSQALQKNLEAWFHEYGERMTGWYKRDNRKWLFLAGLLVAVLADVDTVRLARFLFDGNNAKARMALVAVGLQAAQTARPVGPVFNPTDSAEAAGRPKPPGPPDAVLIEATKQFQSALDAVPKVGLPLGWLRFTHTETERADTTTVVDSATRRRVFARPAIYAWAPAADDYQLPLYAQRWTLNPTTGAIGHPKGWSWWAAGAGWLLTAFAMMLGAPFWFDTLCRFVNIRNIGIKPAPATKT